VRAVVIGASGQVGGLLLQRCRNNGWECLGTAFQHGSEGLLTLDIRDAHAVAGCLRDATPDVVFLPAALTFVDYCETHPDECLAINVEGPANVARALLAQGGRLVFYSTDHVFGAREAAYAEDEPAAPLSVYAKSKAAAEERVRTLLPDGHLILRTSWVFGPEKQRKNFVYRAVRTLRVGQELLAPRDQFGQPTYSVDLADTAVAMAERGLRGTFHAVGPAQVTRLQFAQLIARVFGLDGKLIRGVDTPVGRAVSSPHAPAAGAAPRPLHVALRRDKLVNALGRDPIRNPEAALLEMRDGAAEFRP